MARAIATITGTALAPGISRNKRLYTKEAIAKMVARASERIAAGQRPIAMYTSHDSTDVADVGGVLTRIWQEGDGRARYTAEVPDTPAGRTVATLADTSGGTRFLRNVSVFGNWVGGERAATGPAGEAVTTGPDFELGRLDFVTSPGVDGADIDSLEAVAAGEGAHGYAVAESAPEALVTAVTEETGGRVAEGAPVPEGVREALTVFLGTPVSEAASATPAMSGRKSGLSGGGRKWADPGYQSDKKQRYDITTKDKAVTAWRYIHQASKAAKYSGTQLKQVKNRIRAALKGFGVTPSAEGWVIEPAYQVTEAVAELYGDPSRAGSWSVSASNGPVSLNLSSYSMDPADLDVILRAAAGAACDALKSLDPDMDGDVDVDGAGDGSDTDGDSGGGESAPEDDDPATESDPATAGEEGPAPAGEQEKEVPAVGENTSESGAGAQSGLTLETITEAFTAALAARDAAREQAKADKKAAEEREAAERQKQKEALGALLEEMGIKATPVTETAPEGTPAGSTTESTSTEGGTGGTLTEADVSRRVDEALTEFKQGLVTAGIINPGRAGLTTTEHADPDTAPSGEDLQQMDDDGFAAHLGHALNASATSAVPQLS